MADVDIPQAEEFEPEESYSSAELAYWIVGIFMIPLVPILMVWLFTPWSGM